MLLELPLPAVKLRVLNASSECPQDQVRRQGCVRASNRPGGLTTKFGKGGLGQAVRLKAMEHRRPHAYLDNMGLLQRGAWLVLQLAELLDALLQPGIAALCTYTTRGREELLARSSHGQRSSTTLGPGHRPPFGPVERQPQRFQPLQCKAVAMVSQEVHCHDQLLTNELNSTSRPYSAPLDAWSSAPKEP